MSDRRIKRRAFIKGGAAAGVGLTILPAGILKAGQSPNEKLNIALVGVGGRGRSNTGGVRKENIVALCDVNANNMAAAVKDFPRAKTYEDFRKCLEQKDIDAVVCSTTDQTHAFVNMWAMNRDKHVYSEKPLANSVQEAHLIRETYLKKKDKIATQMGTQIHASDNYRRMVELIRGGAIGTPIEARVWCDRTPLGGGYLPAAGDPPGHLNWDLWIGPACQDHPYNPAYLKGGCLGWNRFWDFGSGQIGDMGSHMMDMAFYGFDLGIPTSCKATGYKIVRDADGKVVRDANGARMSEKGVNDETVPEQLTAEWDHPANDWRPAVKLYWYDGDKKPGMPSKILNRAELPKGTLYKGDKGYLLCDYNMRILMPDVKKGDMTHYTSPKAGDLIPPSVGHHQEWINGCKTGSPTSCNFDYAGAIIENNLLALVAARVGKNDGKEFQWDSKNLKAIGCPEADQYITKQYREGWILNG